jgi:hypothetical protein
VTPILITDEQRGVAADYWAGLLEIEAKREGFRAALYRLLEGEVIGEVYAPDKRHVFYVLDVDYDPCPKLLEALHACGIECRGFMFSAQGIFPGKTSLIFLDGKIAAREGRGAHAREIWSAESKP